MKAELTLPEELVENIANRVILKLKPFLGSNNGGHDRYLNTKQLAEYLGLAYSTIANNRKHLPHTYMNGTPLFKKSEIDTYLEQFRVKPKSKKNQKFMELFNKR